MTHAEAGRLGGLRQKGGKGKISTNKMSGIKTISSNSGIIKNKANIALKKSKTNTPAGNKNF